MNFVQNISWNALFLWEKNNGISQAPGNLFRKLKPIEAITISLVHHYSRAQQYITQTLTANTLRGNSL